MGLLIRRAHGTTPLIAVVLLVLVTLTAVSLAGCGSSSTSSSLTTMSTVPSLSTIVTQASGANAQGPGAKVVIKDGKVDPTELQVPVGSAVTFQDMDDDTARTYHLVSADGTFDTGMLGEGGSYSVTFQKPGTIEYQDTNDPTINGTIIVE